MDKKFAKTAYFNFLIWGICSSLAMTICTLVDAMLVGNFAGSDGLAVANIATPVFLTYALVGVTIGTGANVRIGELLGESSTDEANRVFRAQLTFGVWVGTGLLILSFLLRRGLLSFLGAKGELLYMAEEYLTVVFFSAPIFILYHILSVSVKTDGDPKLAAVASATVIIVNLSLDLLFMKVFHWGIVGASVSLCIAETLGSAILLLHFFKKQALLRLGICIPVPKDIRLFLTNGFGIGSAYIFQALVMLAFNTLLMSFGNEQGVLYVAVFGVIYTVSTIPFAVFDGASSALATVVSIFVGERDQKGILSVWTLGLMVVGFSGLIFGISCMIWSANITKFFGLSDAAVIHIASKAMRIYAVSIPFCGINILITTFWQVIGRSRLAAGMSVARNFVLILVFGGFLIPRYQVDGLVFSYVCTESLCILSVLGVGVFHSSRNYVSKKFRPVGRIYENYYLIDIKSMEHISEDLQSLCEDWKIDTRRSFFINLIVEELLLNINKFGLKNQGKERYIAVKILDNDGEYMLRIRDNVNIYNPFDSSGDAIDDAVLKLISQKAKYCNYQRKLVFNYLYIII